MIVNDLDARGTVLSPLETDPILIVYANAVLSCVFSLQQLQSVSRRYPQIRQSLNRIELVELP